jgi:transposase
LLGRSRGGLTTKIHAACDARCQPLAFVLTAGQAGDCPQLPAVLDRIRVPSRIGPDRTRPDAVAADKAYPSRANRTYLRRRRITAVIPEKTDQIKNRKKKGRRGGRPISFDHDLYKVRNTIERCFNRMKNWRAIATRYCKKPDSYLAALHLCATFIWLRSTA